MTPALTCRAAARVCWSTICLGVIGILFIVVLVVSEPIVERRSRESVLFELTNWTIGNGCYEHDLD